MKEEDLCDRLSRLGDSVRRSTDPFRSIVARAKARGEFEQIIFQLLELREHGKTSAGIDLKLLQAMDELRSPDVSRQVFRLSSIGERRRTRWPQGNPHPHHYRLEGKPDRLRRNRALRSIPAASVDIPIMNCPREGEREAVRWQLSNDEPVFDFSTTLLLHMCFIGNDLVLALDENLGRFCYGAANYQPHALVANSRSFADYGYLPDTLDPSGVIRGPVRIKGVRGSVQGLAEQLHRTYENDVDTALGELNFEQLATSLDSLLGFLPLEERLKAWADRRGCSLGDVCLVFLPDEALFLLPLSTLGLSHRRPLMRALGGTSVAPSLVGLKKSVADHHWGVASNRRPNAPTCVIFATNNQHCPWLDLRPEVDAVERAFAGNSRAVCTCTRHEFAHWYSIADVCWFAGHGAFEVTRGVDIEGHRMALPESGPLFTDGAVTNLDLISGPEWNFKPIWLSVFNSCVLGRHLMVGPNPLGFMSALATAGATAAIGALWPVGNDAANILAGHLAREVVSAFRSHRYPRAAALGRAIRTALDNGEVTERDVAPYVLWGLP
jgi:CHAT domain